MEIVCEKVIAVYLKIGICQVINTKKMILKGGSDKL